MLLKNFGVTRHDRVVFYDYDEIQPHDRRATSARIPPPRDYEEEMSAEPYWSVGPNDVFPEQFDRFLVSRPARARDLPRVPPRPARPEFWIGKQRADRRREQEDVSRTLRRRGSRAGQASPRPRRAAYADRDQQHLQDDQQHERREVDVRDRRQHAPDRPQERPRLAHRTAGAIGAYGFTHDSTACTITATISM